MINENFHAMSGADDFMKRSHTEHFDERRVNSLLLVVWDKSTRDSAAVTFGANL